MLFLCRRFRVIAKTLEMQKLLSWNFSFGKMPIVSMPPWLNRKMSVGLWLRSEFNAPRKSITTPAGIQNRQKQIRVHTQINCVFLLSFSHRQCVRFVVSRCAGEIDVVTQAQDARMHDDAFPHLVHSINFSFLRRNSPTPSVCMQCHRIACNKCGRRLHISKWKKIRFDIWFRFFGVVRYRHFCRRCVSGNQKGNILIMRFMSRFAFGPKGSRKKAPHIFQRIKRKKKTQTITTSTENGTVENVRTWIHATPEFHWLTWISSRFAFSIHSYSRTFNIFVRRARMRSIRKS